MYMLVLNKPETGIKKVQVYRKKSKLKPLKPLLAFGHRDNNQFRNIDNKLSFE